MKWNYETNEPDTICTLKVKEITIITLYNNVVI